MDADNQSRINISSVSPGMIDKMRKQRMLENWIRYERGDLSVYEVIADCDFLYPYKQGFIIATRDKKSLCEIIGEEFHDERSEYGSIHGCCYGLVKIIKAKRLYGPLKNKISDYDYRIWKTEEYR